MYKSLCTKLVVPEVASPASSEKAPVFAADSSKAAVIQQPKRGLPASRSNDDVLRVMIAEDNIVNQRVGDSSPCVQ